MIYVLWIDANFIPTHAVESEQEARKRIEAHFGQRAKFVLTGKTPKASEREPDTIYPVSHEEFLLALRPGDVVIGNMAVTTAAKVIARGARLLCHAPSGKLFEYSVREVGPTPVVNPPWNATGKWKMPVKP